MRLLRHLLTALVALYALHAWAGSEAAPLSAQDQARLVRLVTQALEDRDINPQQYQATIHWIHAAPCQGVDRRLNARHKTRLEAALARQFDLPKVQVFDTFRQGRWWIVYADASRSDTPYLIYSGNPIDGIRPMAVWSGAATIFETDEIAQWTRDQAPGIPPSLANCFAWHVTLDPR